MPIILDSLDLATAERQLCSAALNAGGSIVEAANLLGITRHALKRRIVKHQIEWPMRPNAGGHERPLPRESMAVMHS